MKEHRNIVVIGSYLVALVMNTKRLPLPGETIMARNFRQVHGGKGSNQAVQAARLGASTSFVGRVGKDDFGEAFLRLCEKEGINADFVSQSSTLPTGAGFIVCDDDGTNIITIDIAAINEFGRQDVDAAMGLVTTGSTVLLQLEIPLHTALYAARKCREKGAIVILNPAPAQDLTGLDLSCIDFLTPNETEARICLGMPHDTTITDEQAACALLKLGCKNVVITLGETGNYLCNNDVQVAIPGFIMHEVVDTTGAGDGFNAGLAVALLEGRNVMEALEFANAVGGLSVTCADTIPSYHTRDQVEAFLALQKAVPK